MALGKAIIIDDEESPNEELEEAGTVETGEPFPTQFPAKEEEPEAWKYPKTLMPHAMPTEDEVYQEIDPETGLHRIVGKDRYLGVKTSNWKLVNEFAVLWFAGAAWISIASDAYPEVGPGVYKIIREEKKNNV